MMEWACVSGLRVRATPKAVGLCPSCRSEYGEQGGSAAPGLTKRPPRDDFGRCATSKIGRVQHDKNRRCMTKSMTADFDYMLERSASLEQCMYGTETRPRVCELR